MNRPLSPQEMYPAGVAGVATRMIALDTGVQLRVAESGPATGEPVVLLHGWTASLYMYRHVLALLPSSGLRVLAPDLRGFGLADKPVTPDAYTLDAYLADTAALLDALRLDRVALVGQSMGGGIALQFALRMPARLTRLVLINPTGLAPVSYVALLRLVPRELVSALGSRVIPRALVDFILRRIAYSDASLVADRDVDEYWAPTLLPGFVRAASCALSEFSWDPASAAELERLAVPSVVILGRQDRLVRGANQAAERIRGAEIHTFDGGHCVHEEHPREVCELIARSLRESPHAGS